MAAFENPIGVTSFPSSVDMSATPFRAVKLSAGSLALAGVGEVAVGLVQNKPALNATGTVMFCGISRGVASAAITQGAKVAPAASGKLRTAVSGDTPIGVALADAGAVDEVFPVALTCIGGTPLP